MECPSPSPDIVVPDAPEVGHIVSASERMDRIFSKFSEREIQAMVEDSNEIARMLEMEPSKGDFVDAFGRENIIQESSEWRVRICDPSWSEEKNRKRLALYLEMTEPKRRVEVNRAAERSAKMESEMVRDNRSGLMRPMPIVAVQMASRKGWLGAVRQHFRVSA